MKIIAKIQNDFRSKFGVPRQSGLASQVESLVIFEPEYRCAEALRGIEAYSHLWLLWQFSESITDKFRPTVRPPRLGGNKRMGVFATRSPFRPNPIGLSSVRLLGLEKSEEYGIALRVSGADLMDGTPIYDIKPYLAYTDSHPDAVCGFAEEFLDYALEVDFPEELLAVLAPHQREAVIEVLKNDPRPSYQSEESRVYSMEYGDFDIKFTVSGNRLTVCGAEPFGKGEQGRKKNLSEG